MSHIQVFTVSLDLFSDRVYQCSECVFVGLGSHGGLLRGHFVAPGPRSLLDPHLSHAGSSGAAEALRWVAAPVPAEAVGCGASQACNPPLRV